MTASVLPSVRVCPLLILESGCTRANIVSSPRLTSKVCAGTHTPGAPRNPGQACPPQDAGPRPLSPWAGCQPALGRRLTRSLVLQVAQLRPAGTGPTLAIEERVVSKRGR